MRSRLIRILACAVALSLLILPGGIAVAESGDELTCAVAGLSGSFDPFDPSGTDGLVVRMTTAMLLDRDRAGNVVLHGIDGETALYAGTEYTYRGSADCGITEENGGFRCEITLRDDLRFSDGSTADIDDVIFSMYVLLDPDYAGGASFASLPVLGLSEYRTGATAEECAAFLAEAEQVRQAGYEVVTESGARYWEQAVSLGGVEFARSVGAYYAGRYPDFALEMGSAGAGLFLCGFADRTDGGLTLASTGRTWSLEGEDAPGYEDLWNEISMAFLADGVSVESLARIARYYAADENLFDCIDRAYAGICLAGRETAPAIQGIVRTGDNTMELHVAGGTADDIASALTSVPVAPLHYYGDEGKYAPEDGKFGFDKGDLSGIRDLAASPVGAGAYRLSSWDDGVAVLSANDGFYLGAPVAAQVTLRNMEDWDALSALATGGIDLADMALTAQILDMVRTLNTDTKSLVGNGVACYTRDGDNYGYIGINGGNVVVPGNEAASLSLRNAFAAVFAGVRRDCGIPENYRIVDQLYCGYWADGGDVPFARLPDGTQVDTAGSGEELDRALAGVAREYLIGAGYVWDESTSLFTAPPYGGRMSFTYTCFASGENPLVGIGIRAAAILQTLGIELKIDQIPSRDAFWSAVQSGSDIWAAARQMDDQNPYAGKWRGEKSMNGVECAALPEDADARYSAILALAVEVPVYMGQYALIMRQNSLAGVPGNYTATYNWARDIHLFGRT